MLPEKFAEQNIRVYTKKIDERSISVSTRCFHKWCTAQHMMTPKVCLTIQQLLYTIFFNFYVFPKNFNIEKCFDVMLLVVIIIVTFIIPLCYVALWDPMRAKSCMHRQCEHVIAKALG